MSVIVKFWPEIKNVGLYICASLREAIKAKAPDGFINLKVTNHSPSGRKNIVIGFIEGHKRPLPTRQLYLEQLYKAASKSKRPSFLIITGWETESDTLMNPDILKSLPEHPEGLRIYTCQMKLHDLQINTLIEECLK